MFSQVFATKKTKNKCRQHRLLVMIDVSRKMNRNIHTLNSFDEDQKSIFVFLFSYFVENVLKSRFDSNLCKIRINKIISEAAIKFEIQL